MEPKDIMQHFSYGDKLLEGEKLGIRTFPDPVLKKVARPVEDFNSELEKLCRNLLYTMYISPGIGLAAPQVGVSERIFVMDIGYNREKVTAPDGNERHELSNFEPRIFINPKFINKDGETEFEEGCLSLPGVFETIKRAEKIKVEYCDVKGDTHELEADDLLSICIQHENDHLDGIVMLDKMSMLKRTFYSKKLAKSKKR